MKRVLYLAYYWPPCGGIGPVRNLKFTKYFREFGWEPVVYSPANAQYILLDESTFKDFPEGVEIIKTPLREPYGLFNVLKGKKKTAQVKDVFLDKDEKKSLIHQFGIWVRANFFIPDARAQWIKPSIAYLRKYLKHNPVDAIISYGPPHSMHMIALALHKEFGIPWVSDWQDPWTQIDYYEKFPMTKAARNKHERMEQEVLHTANKVVMVSKSWCVDLEKLSGREVAYIPFGYDEQDFSGLTNERSEFFTISHFGTFGTDRNPRALWQALAELKAEHPDLSGHLRIHLAGNVAQSVFDSLTQHGLQNNLYYESFIGKDRLFQQLRNSDVQLVLINEPEKGLAYNNKGRIPAKVFECIGAQRPILVIGPMDGDVAAIVAETSTGVNCNYTDTEKIKASLLLWYKGWLNKEVSLHPIGVERYSFRNLCGEMAKVLNAAQTS